MSPMHQSYVTDMLRSLRRKGSMPKRARRRCSAYAPTPCPVMRGVGARPARPQYLTEHHRRPLHGPESFSAAPSWSPRRGVAGARAGYHTMRLSVEPRGATQRNGQRNARRNARWRALRAPPSIAKRGVPGCGLEGGSGEVTDAAPATPRGFEGVAKQIQGIRRMLCGLRALAVLRQA